MTRKITLAAIMFGFLTFGALTVSLVSSNNGLVNEAVAAEDK
jgi:hypothetical protein